ncbi:tetratricopeptide repeat protein [Aliikangiella sp. IMCC44359]|uniref:tetratricopeptide repeat protein n=1 Tax=Aliikangiella sp. IMCC44359 TaxID=3459125 RepID=UPI00403B226A
MSLINQVLKDLEKNTKQNQPLQFNTIAIEEKKSNFFIGTIISTILITTCYLFYVFYKPDPSLQVQEKNKLNITSQKIIQANKTLGKEVALTINTAELTSEPKEIYAKPSKPIKVAQVKKSPDLVVPKNKPLAKSTKKTEVLANSQPVQNNKLKTNNVIGKNRLTSSNIKKESQETLLKKRLKQIRKNHSSDNILATQQAIDLLLKDNPDFHTARQYLIKVCWNNIQCNVPELFKIAIKLYPNYVNYRLLAARYFFDRQQFELAEKYLLVKDNPINKNINLIQIRALTRQKLNKHNLAIADYATILESNPTRGDIYLAIGISFDAIGQINKARRSFQSALADQRLSTKQQQFAENKITSYQG